MTTVWQNLMFIFSTAYDASILFSIGLCEYKLEENDTVAFIYFVGFFFFTKHQHLIVLLQRAVTLNSNWNKK